MWGGACSRGVDGTHWKTTIAGLVMNGCVFALQYVVPVALISTESAPITSSNPKLDVKLSNIFDEKVSGAVTVTLGFLQQPDGTKERRNKALTTEDKYVRFGSGCIQ